MEKERVGLLCCGVNVLRGEAEWLPKTPLPKERSEERFTVERVLLSRGMPKERLLSVDIPKERGRDCD